MSEDGTLRSPSSEPQQSSAEDSALEDGGGPLWVLRVSGLALLTLFRGGKGLSQ